MRIWTAHLVAHRRSDAQDLSSPSISNAFYSESTTSHVAFRRLLPHAGGDDAMVLTEPIGDIPAKQHADMEIDVAGQDASLELEVPEVDFNKENAKGEGT
ncbi:hypothetical protein Tco_0036253, partial [Tanacetum coccineum]